MAANHDPLATALRDILNNRNNDTRDGLRVFYTLTKSIHPELKKIQNRTDLTTRGILAAILYRSDPTETEDHNDVCYAIALAVNKHVQDTVGRRDAPSLPTIVQQVMRSIDKVTTEYSAAFTLLLLNDANGLNNMAAEVIIELQGREVVREYPDYAQFWAYQVHYDAVLEAEQSQHAMTLRARRGFRGY